LKRQTRLNHHPDHGQQKEELKRARESKLERANRGWEGELVKNETRQNKTVRTSKTNQEEWVRGDEADSMTCARDRFSARDDVELRASVTAWEKLAE